MTTTHTTTKTHFYLRVLAALMALAIAMSALVEGAGPAKAAFPGQNGRVAFISFRDGNYEIYSMKPDGTEQRNLTKNSVDDMYPAVSPNGRKIAYESYGVQFSNPEGDGEVFVMNASDGSGQANLTYNGIDVNDYEADFSPNGTKIAYQSYGVQGTNSEGDSEVYVVNASDGTGQKNLSNNGPGVHDFAPDWGRQAT